MAFLAILVKPGRGLITRATALSINLLFNAVQNSDLRPQAPGNDIANLACNLQPDCAQGACWRPAPYRGVLRPASKPQVSLTTWVVAKARRWRLHKKQLSDLGPFYELIAGFKQNAL